jgi:hypothetical protein
MFVVEDQDHPQMIEIRAELERSSGIMHDVEEEEKGVSCVSQ